jgi:hypothetical protein
VLLASLAIVSAGSNHFQPVSEIAKLNGYTGRSHLARGR